MALKLESSQESSFFSELFTSTSNGLLLKKDGYLSIPHFSAIIFSYFVRNFTLTMVPLI